MSSSIFELLEITISIHLRGTGSELEVSWLNILSKSVPREGNLPSSSKNHRFRSEKSRLLLLKCQEGAGGIVNWKWHITTLGNTLGTQLGIGTRIST
ncbi:hypothetical protein Tco_0974760 [Tanacetum coccineum]|uniref:Uncharacterized protein n=1 Tax=Tanacetum coccineum TaxID=301880 RepID=A0ABQ5ECJ1_9ASTR